ncbi:MAG TPA: M23 family metallopeptidase [Candidatus Onthovicinus excrementipullorum]|nr:M23 family metallopeptidase [Candidatus Onthovicinus excrementipullorum]
MTEQEYDPFDSTAEDMLTQRRLERAERTRTQEGENRQTGWSFTAIIGVQAVVCAVLIGILVALFFAAPDTFAGIRDEYRAMQAQEITSVEASAWWEKVKSAMSHGVGDDLMEQNLEETGAGGADVPMADSLKFPGSNMSFSPVYVTSRAYLPVDGTITSPFGARVHPVTGEDGYHTGLDIAAAEGTRIAAAYYGTVSDISEDDVSGKYIILDHGNGLKTFYCHCSEILAEKGAVVRAGETIAFVGATGQVTGPHLHFEIRLDGVRHNPAFVFAGMLDGI